MFGPATLLRWLAHVAGFEIHRSRPVNRFQNMDGAVAHLRSGGLAPSLIIDAGANVGEWACIAREVFPHARLMLIEPQQACESALRQFAGEKTTVHLVALAEPGRTQVQMEGVESGKAGTGAYVAGLASSSSTTIVATTLDELTVASSIQSSERILLKLDLEGYEIRALEGAKALLRHVEVVITEFAFYKINGNSERPLLSDFVRLLGESGFILYDVATLSARVRDNRLRMGDAIFVKDTSPLARDCAFA